MKIVCILLFGCLPLHSFSKPTQDCLELKSEQIRLAVTASNLENLNSTRTPDGGAYLPFKITSCNNGRCKIERTNNPIIKYLPDHPDADKNGFVAFPNIDEKSEYAIFNMTAIKLKLLASAKACGATALIDKDNSSFMLRYDGTDNVEVKEDIFNLNSNHQVVSWMRQDSKGRVTTISFSSIGQVVSHSHSQ